ncbi:MAG: hypothetical protein KF764_18600 [Labilithrix sp.]|nr:hypothetical protein [Labilithrix sp.]
MRSQLLLLVALSAVACSVPAAESATSESANTEGRPLTAIKGREWGRCWFDVAGDSATLSCTSTERAANDPLTTTLDVSAAGLNSPPGQGFEGYRKALDLEAGGTVVVGTFRRSSFPVMLILSANLARESSELIGQRGRTDFQATPQIARPEDLPSSAPAVMSQPFDLWPTAFIDASGQEGRFVLMTPEHTRSIAPLSSFGGDTEMKLRPWISGSTAKGKIHYFVAPAAGAIDATLHVSGVEVATQIERPGYYAVTSAGLRPATPEEIATDFPSGSTPDVGPTTDGDEDGTGEPPPPPPPIDPDPTCGGDGQARCANTSCDNGTRWDASSARCVACGAAGQTFCLDEPNNASANASRKCNGGTRWDSSSARCVECGGAGQTFCLDDANNYSPNASRKCDAGTRWDSSSARCVECGGAGQTFCLDDANNYSPNASRKCDAGTRWDSSSARCVECGGAGQTFCLDDANNYNPNASRKCNGGTRWDTNAAKCQPCGDEGQTYCFADANNYNSNSSRVCNPGLRYDTSAQRCAR